MLHVHSRVRASFAALALLLLSLAASRPSLALPERNVPTGLVIATDQGRVEPGQEMNLTVLLKMRDRAAFDRAVEALYDPASPTFHEWFTDEDFAKYAPTSPDFETVRAELVKQGFRVVSVDPQRFSIRVHGTAEIVEKAFQTELHTFNYNGRVFQAHIRDARLTGAAGDLVESVAGLERHQAHPQLLYLKNPKTGQPVVKRPLATKKDLASFAASLTAAPLTTASPELFGGPSAISYFDGTQYAANGALAALTPANLQAHYGLTPVLKAGYNGAGQTIALVEGYGYPTAEADANAAASLFGLPALTSSTFSVIYPEGMPLNPNAGIETGWNTEIALDVQSAHAIAPGAKIVILASAGQDNEDLLASLQYIVTNKTASTVSNSWGTDSEAFSGMLEEQAFNTVLQMGAAAGISFQFSSGDDGDDGFGTPVGSVEVPCNSPFATAVGGTSILNNPYGTGQIVTGWGNDEVYLYAYGAEDPLEGYYFGGAGGGQSLYYAKPTWQSSLPGTWREVPDVAALADPFTGFPVVVTEGGKQYGYVIGGTSLASPIISATWAIADQYNGKALGQAAPAIAKLTASQISDVVPPPASVTAYNVTGLIKDSSGLTSYNATQIFTDAIDLDEYPNNLSLYNQKVFLSANWQDAFDSSNYDVAVSFGTDSSLTVTAGWDNVTGWGEPNGLPFIQGVTGKTTGAPLSKKK